MYVVRVVCTQNVLVLQILMVNHYKSRCCFLYKETQERLRVKELIYQQVLFSR